MSAAARDEDAAGAPAPRTPSADVWQLRLDTQKTEGKVDQLIATVTEMRVELKELKGTFVTKTDLKSVEDRLFKIEGWNTWLLRIVLGGFLAALCGLVYVKGGVPAP